MPEIIRSIRLEATSIRNAWYELRATEICRWLCCRKKNQVSKVQKDSPSLTIVLLYQRPRKSFFSNLECENQRETAAVSTEG